MYFLDFIGLYDSFSSNFLIIYGRRRVGKSTLINHFIKDKPAIFFQAVESSSLMNLQYLSQRINEFKYGEDLNFSASHSDFRQALLEINELAKQSPEKLIFVIDEFPYLVEAEKTIASVLQDVIDNVFKHNDNIMLILCGSSMSFMKKQVLGSKSPLYGRRSAQFKLLPFTIFETALFLDTLSKEEIVTYHGITGGIPQYLEFIDTAATIEQNINQLYLTNGAPLLEEPHNLLKQELRTPATYNAILNAISQGRSKYNDIASIMNIASGTLNNYLNNLIDLGIVMKKVSFSDSKARRPVYQIKDGMFRFWFRFIDGNTERIIRNRTSVLSQKIMQELSQFLGTTFEEVAMDWIWENTTLGFEPKSVCSWWGHDSIEKTQVEVDIVAPDDTNKIGIIGECKWRDAQNLENKMIDTLIHRSGLVPSIRKKELYFFVKETKVSFSEYAKENDVRVIELDSMF
ncbi:MAG: ATP-binding protein [Streptococcaceae bacterium]|jgi:AAA+ ATPase superfamily predicted ATPase|nr:ATP-binding protein [Streptococcaceae bacterium]